MSDPTDPNDKEFSSTPGYVWSNNRWQYRGTNYVAPAKNPNDITSVRAETATRGFGNDWIDFIGGFSGGGPPGLTANTRLAEAGITGKGFSDPQSLEAIRAGLARGPSSNPYDYSAAAAARPGYIAALDALHNGPSAAAPMNRQAMGQAGMASVAGAAGATSPLAGALALRSGVAGMGGVASAGGNNALQEYMAKQSGYGAGLGSLRTADMEQAKSGFQAGNKAAAQDEALRQFFVAQGMSYDEAVQRSALENFKLRQRLKTDIEKGNIQSTKDFAQGGATMLSRVAGG